MDPQIKASTGISIGLVITLIGVITGLLGGLIWYIFTKCKIGWTADDTKIKDKFEKDLKTLDKDNSKALKDEIDKMNENREKSEDKITMVIQNGFDKIHKKIDSNSTTIHEKIDEIKKDMGELHTNVGIINSQISKE